MWGHIEHRASSIKKRVSKNNLRSSASKKKSDTMDLPEKALSFYHDNKTYDSSINEHQH